jgi:hypothetical protein
MNEDFFLDPGVEARREAGRICPDCGEPDAAQIWGVWNGCGNPWHWEILDEEARKS